MESILEGFGLKKQDLNFHCPPTIRFKIAERPELIDNWYILGRTLEVSVGKLDSIRVDNVTRPSPALKAVGALDAWDVEYGSGATCLKLAKALYDHKMISVFEFLCEEVNVYREKTSESATTSGASTSTLQPQRRQLEEGKLYQVQSQICSKERKRSRPNLWDEEQIKVSSCEKFPFLKIESVNKAEEIRVHGILFAESEGMVVEFKRLFNATRESLVKRNVSVKDLLKKIDCMGHIKPTFIESTLPVLGCQLQELRKLENVDDAMSVIVDYCSFFNYQLVEEIINDIGTEQDKTNLDNYHKKFSEYGETLLCKCPSNLAEMIENGQSNMLVTLDVIYESYTVNHLYTFVKKLEMVLKVPLRLCRIGPGSLKLTFQLPHSLQQAIFPLSSEQEEALSGLSVEQLSCGDYQFTRHENEEVDNPATDRDSDHRKVRTLESPCEEVKYEKASESLTTSGPSTSTLQSQKNQYQQEGTKMETAFTKNKSRIVPILERNLATVVPKLYSVGLISEQDRDVALIHSVDSNTRAAALTRAVEGKVLHYHELLVFVYAVVSSTIEVAEKDFIKSLAYSVPEHVTRTRRESLGESPAQSTTLPHRRRSSDPMIIWKDNLESISLPPSTDTTLQSNEATCASPTTSGDTNIPEPETDISQSEDQIEESVEHNFDKAFLKSSSTWYKHAQKFPAIKFSNYYTKQVVTYRGDIIKGEGIELQIPGRAIKREDTVEFTIQACIDGPFELPEDVNLITPVYVISPHYEFQREVTVLMDSFVRLQRFSEKDLIFLTSPTKREVDVQGFHWKFDINKIQPWSDSVKERRIILEVPHFCLFCVGLRRRVPQYDYRVSLHSPLASINYKWCHAIFSVSLHHEVFTKNLKVYLDSFSHKFQVTCETPVQITQDEIILQLPDNTESLGLKIIADKKKIFKGAVDRPTRSWRHRKHAMRDIESYPPRITLTVTYTREVRSPRHWQLRFNGIREVDSFNLTIPYVREMTISHVPAITGSDVSSHRMRTVGPNNDQRLRMSNLLDLTLETTTSYKNIPKEIEGRHHNSRSLLLADELAIAASPKDGAQLILQKWLDGEGHQPASWGTLSAALKHIELMGDLRLAIMKSRSLELTMNTLLNFPYKTTVTKSANIPREVGVKHFEFGTHLLQDPTGAHLRDLEEELRNNGEKINRRILTEWLEGEGRPVTWVTLVQVLDIIGMGELAKQIEVRYVNDKSSVTM